MASEGVSFRVTAVECISAVGGTSGDVFGGASSSWKADDWEKYRGRAADGSLPTRVQTALRDWALPRLSIDIVA
jgi:hypothetical protein